MEKVKSINSKLEAVAWGLLFVWWGMCLLVPGLPGGACVGGSGLILIGINLARVINGIPTDGFSLILGILALVEGCLEFLRTTMRLSITLPSLPILLIIFGSVLLVREIAGMLHARPRTVG